MFKKFIDAYCESADAVIWCIVSLIELAFFIAIFFVPRFAQELFESNWMILLIPILLPILVLSVVNIEQKTS